MLWKLCVCLLLFPSCHAPDQWHLFGGYLDLNDGDVEGWDMDQSGPFVALGVSGALGSAPYEVQPLPDPPPLPVSASILEVLEPPEEGESIVAWLLASLVPISILLRSLGIDLGSRVHGRLRRNGQ